MLIFRMFMGDLLHRCGYRDSYLGMEGYVCMYIMPEGVHGVITVSCQRNQKITQYLCENLDTVQSKEHEVEFESAPSIQFTYIYSKTALDSNLL